MRRQLSLAAAVVLLATNSAHAWSPLTSEPLVCEHLREAIRTPAPLKVALISVENVLFTCPGDKALKPQTYLMADVDELAGWNDRRLDLEDPSSEEKRDE